VVMDNNATQKLFASLQLSFFNCYDNVAIKSSGWTN